MVHERSADVAGRLRAHPDRGRRRGRDAARAQGRGVREGRQGARLQCRVRARGMGRDPRAAAERDQGEPVALDQGRCESPRRQRRDDDRRAPAVSDDGGRHAAVSGDQRQRLGDQEQVRQHLRLPSLGHRRPEPRDRRHARRQGRGRVRLRRGRQGLRSGPPRPGRPRHRHRDRPDLRAAGGDGRVTRSRRSRTSSRPPTSS